jgi:SAM-dependent methyltransferase
MNQVDRPKTVTAEEWDHRYRSGDVPWDTQRPSRELQHVLEANEANFATPGCALELGCGAGTNAICLAEHGFQVTAVDLSALAIDRARQRAQTAGVRVDFFVADVTSLPAGISTGEPFDFVFDRGCYHCVRRVNLAGYLAAVAALTRPGSRLLVLAGNADEAEVEGGPPRVHEEEIRAELGTHFDIQWIRPFHFDNVDGSDGPLAWSVGLVRRDI